jgi:hypothetical protein
VKLCVECLEQPARGNHPASRARAKYCSTRCRDRANHKRRTAVKDDLQPAQIDALFRWASRASRGHRWPPEIDRFVVGK